jgi:glutaredoxin
MRLHAVPAGPGVRRPEVPQVKVYALTTCPYCRMTRTYLDDSGVAYEAVEVDTLEGEERAATIAEVKRLSGGTSFPVVVVDDEVVVGFNKPRIAKLVATETTPD